MRMGSPLGAHCSREGRLWCARVEIAIHEIGDDFDGALDVELFEGLIQEVMRDGGDAVALLDGEFGDGEIAAVAADQCDVRAVKRGDEGQTARGGHGAREHGADGVGNGVVDVEQIERFGLEDFEHFGGESKRVRRVIEKRIAGDFDLVKMDVRIVGIHADRRGVADEMDVVAASGEFLAEFGGDDAGAAVRGVAGDANLHG